MPAPRKPRLRHIPVRLRVSVDPERWRAVYGRGDETLAEIEEDVRVYVLSQVQESAAAHDAAIVGARRDGL
jgi:hypothetical protein